MYPGNKKNPGGKVSIERKFPIWKFACMFVSLFVLEG